MRLAHPRALAALLAATLALPGLGPRVALAGCELRPDLNVMGLTLASPGSSGRLVGRWLGAYPLTCEGETYQLAVTADTLAALEQAAADPDRDGSIYLIGDFPYFGDGVCISGAVRRWWEPGPGGGGQPEQRWEGTSVPLLAPALSCPINQPGDGPLVLLPSG